MKKSMLINVLQPEESRIAILEDGVLEELYVERTSQEKLVGNIYKGRIVNIEPSIQAAFVDFGVGRNGFLHVSDVEPQYFRHGQNGKELRYEELPDSHETDDDEEGRPPEPVVEMHGDPIPIEGEPGDMAERPPEPRKQEPRRERRVPYRGMRSKPPIQQIFKRGQEVLVQVIKEGIGTKGPTLSTYLSIPGRYLVLMPGLNRFGVSRKIEDEQHRRQLRDILKELNPPRGLGFIVRTAGLERSKRDLQRDLAYLTRLWKVVVRRINKTRAPAAIYQESDMITRTIRDIFTNDIDVIWVDEPNAYETAKEFLQITMPRFVPRLQLYQEREPLFHRHRLEDEIARIHQRHVPLPQGGSIVIEQTEALVAIDVNSGNFRADNSAEETAFRMNIAAAKEIARQLRLRDLGGVIVNDFIDMREERHSREVERVLREAVSRDRARTKILKMSAFGIIEMTRQRIRPSLKRSVYEDCPSCHGTGQVKTAESMSIEVMRLLQLAANHSEVSRINVNVHGAVANYLNNRKRQEVAKLEEAGTKCITIRGSEIVSPEHLVLECLDASGSECKVATTAVMSRAGRPLPPTRGPDRNARVHAEPPPVSRESEPERQPSQSSHEAPPSEHRGGSQSGRRRGRRRGGRGRGRSRNRTPQQDSAAHDAHSLEVGIPTGADDLATQPELPPDDFPPHNDEDALERRPDDMHNDASFEMPEPTEE